MTTDDVDELIWQDAVEQAAAIRTGRASAVSLLDAYLERIDRHDPTLRAFVAVDVDRAREAARAADDAVRKRRGEALPPFLGVALSIKDVIDVAGLPTSHSSAVLVDNVAAADDPLVTRFRDAGFVIVGKTNVPEFCTTMTDSALHGTCRNPWDTDRTPGGSSGGAAAALAAALCALSHGTDGAGSVRCPASYCGLVGLKPTRGLVGFGPELRDPVYGTTVDGILTRSVRDAAGVLDALVDPPGSAASWSPRPARPYAAELLDESPRLRIALSTQAPLGDTDPQCAAAARDTAELLASHGHEVEEATPRWEAMLAVSVFPMEAPGAAALVPADRFGEVEPRNRPLLERLSQLTVREHTEGVHQVRAAALTFLAFWDDHDVLLTPTVGIVSPSVDWARWDQDPQSHMETFMAFPSFAQPFNLTGQPAISVPSAWSQEGLPIGVQLAGRRLDELVLLQVARELETARPWSGRRPPGFA